MKALGSAAFVDSIFATSKDDLTPEAYAAHKRHITAPQPLSSREQELADIRAAENNSLSHQGTMARTSHVNDPIGFPWSDEAETAIVNFSRADGCAVVILVSKRLVYVAAVCAEAMNSKSTHQRKR